MHHSQPVLQPLVCCILGVMAWVHGLGKGPHVSPAGRESSRGGRQRAAAGGEGNVEKETSTDLVCSTVIAVLTRGLQNNYSISCTSISGHLGSGGRCIIICGKKGGVGKRTIEASLGETSGQMPVIFTLTPGAALSMGFGRWAPGSRPSL